jgi:hypothetical protein
VRDRDVRRALHLKVLKDHHGDPETLVLDELGLCHGTCRVDIAVVNGYLHGYEIKSDADTLERLPGQVAIYSSVLDRATLVVGERHIGKATVAIPDWWGIKIAIAGPRGGIEFRRERPEKLNTQLDGLAVAALLWRGEAIEILRGLGATEKMLRKPRSALYKLIADEMDIDELRDLVRQRLKARERWRGQRPPLSDADLSTPKPM